MKTNDGVSGLGRLARLAIGLGAILLLHWSLKTLAPALPWLEEPRFVQSVAVATAIAAAGALVSLTRGAGPGRRDHERRTGKHWESSGPATTEAQS